jgi:hypothetical protein
MGASAPATAEHHAHADRYTGSFRFVGGERQTRARDAAIDEVVAELNVLLRGIARTRLTATNPMPESLDIERQGDVLSIAIDGRKHDAHLDGSKTKTRGIEGNELRYHVEVGDVRIRQVFHGEKERRINVLRLRGDRIEMHVVIASPRLPKSLEYDLTFEKR